MKRKISTIADLALEAETDVNTALLILRAGGLGITSPSATVPRRHIKKARHLLDLGKKPGLELAQEVVRLAARTGKSELDARELLAKKGILKKKNSKRIPMHLIQQAEAVLVNLGIQTSPQAINVTVHPTKEAPPESIKERRTSLKDWPIIGRSQDLTYLTPNDVNDIHWVLVKDFARSKDPVEPPGIRDQGLLESAVHRPRTALGADDKYPTVAMAAAALLHSLVLDHPFHNGNKRTAMVSTLAFLDKNSWVMLADQDQIYDFLLQLADHKLQDKDGTLIVGSDAEVLHCAMWLQGRIRKVRFHEHPIQFRNLRTILSAYDCEIEHTKGGGRVNVTRGDLHTQVSYWNEGTDVDKNTIHKIRRDLHLDEAHGYDSDIFYNQGPRIPEFINKYRKLLTRLAKV